ncbi:MAG: uncharacterized protein KVP18_001283 [Porospora cf. gigantea A]|uniref:uncharacterized protein n=1 Tax=Porospora cf. gigantea A TaxID=2853593 RepID=UPI00355A2AD3|nr:MAG: hypothetical protein KVP18_001283 [Porospora cf. gigantea A]
MLEKVRGFCLLLGVSWLGSFFHSAVEEQRQSQRRIQSLLANFESVVAGTPFKLGSHSGQITLTKVSPEVTLTDARRVVLDDESHLSALEQKIVSILHLHREGSSGTPPRPDPPWFQQHGLFYPWFVMASSKKEPPTKDQLESGALGGIYPTFLQVPALQALESYGRVQQSDEPVPFATVSNQPPTYQFLWAHHLARFHNCNLSGF